MAFAKINFLFKQMILLSQSDVLPIVGAVPKGYFLLNHCVLLAFLLQNVKSSGSNRQIVAGLLAKKPP